MAQDNQPNTQCSKCTRRKGKRSCPALGGQICPRCCGTFRLEAIDCPPDCTYLEGAVRKERKDADRHEAALEFYNHEREGSFSSPVERYATYVFESICYRYWEDKRSLEVEDVAGSYEAASRMLGSISFVGDGRDTLAAILAQTVERGAAFTALKPPPEREFFIKVLRRLADFARRYEKNTSPWKGYFRGLEHVFTRVRLPGAPEATEEPSSGSIVLPGSSPPTRQPGRSPGGLIVLPGD